MSNEEKIGYYFLRISAERFASDLRNFGKEAVNFSDEQLYGIVAYSSDIETQIADLKRELEKRADAK